VAKVKKKEKERVGGEKRRGTKSQKAKKKVIKGGQVIR
jgi:hypothetical protein